MFGREPVVIAALIRAVIYCAVLFGLKWSAEQIAGVMLVVETGLAVITRQSVTPNQNVLLERPKDDKPSGGGMGLGGSNKTPAYAVLFVVGMAAGLSACAGNRIPAGTPAHVAVAHTGTAVLNGITETEKFILNGYKAGTIPASVSDPAMEAAHQAVEGARRLSAALKAVDAARKLGNLSAEQLATAQVQAALAEVEKFTAQVFGTQFPAGLTSSILRLAQKVAEAVGTVRGFFPAAVAPTALERSFQRRQERYAEELVADETIWTASGRLMIGRRPALAQ